MTQSEIQIKDLLAEAGKHLLHEFESIKNSNPHFGERGEESEMILIEFLNNHLPKRFSADTGFIIDYQNHISKQIDVLLFDSLNSPIYRSGPKTRIIPIDNIACVIEVKTNLNKKQLEDAAEKISSVKQLTKTPLSKIDQPVTFSKLINTNTLGVVFAYESSTDLETLTENIRDINRNYPSNQWIDFVCVLNKGIIGYVVQPPFEQKIPGWFGGPADENFVIPPYYIHLIFQSLDEFTLNKFFWRLMSHLTFFRKISSIDFESIMGTKQSLGKNIDAYQYNLKRELVPVDQFHRDGDFVPYSIPINIYTTKDKKYKGQITWIPWQDGCILSYSGLFPPEVFFHPFEIEKKIRIKYLRGSSKANLWITIVLPISKDDFLSFFSGIKGELSFEPQDPSDNKEPWLKYET